jgi:hypothetical protein
MIPASTSLQPDDSSALAIRRMVAGEIALHSTKTGFLATRANGPWNRCATVIACPGGTIDSRNPASNYNSKFNPTWISEKGYRTSGPSIREGSDVPFGSGAGKRPKVAMIAAMHKLLIAIYSVAKHRRPFVAKVSATVRSPSY